MLWGAVPPRAVLVPMDGAGTEGMCPWIFNVLLGIHPGVKGRIQGEKKNKYWMALKKQGCDISSSTGEVTAQGSTLGTIELNTNINRLFFFLAGQGRRSLELCPAR